LVHVRPSFDVGVAGEFEELLLGHVLVGGRVVAAGELVGDVAREAREPSGDTSREGAAVGSRALGAGVDLGRGLLLGGCGLAPAQATGIALVDDHAGNHDGGDRRDVGDQLRRLEGGLRLGGPARLACGAARRGATLSLRRPVAPARSGSMVVNSIPPSGRVSWRRGSPRKVGGVNVAGR
jgi:hypothetical protein